jgi:hydrogenase maturation protease
MADDSVGIRVARMIQARLHGRMDIVVKELSVSGIRLVEEMLEFDNVIIIDSHTGNETELGRIRRFAPADFIDRIHPGAPHGINFATALEFYKGLEPRKIPRSIEIYTIDISSELVFGEELSPAVEKASEELANLVVHELSPK